MSRSRSIAFVATAAVALLTVLALAGGGGSNDTTIGVADSGLRKMESRAGPAGGQARA